jgi:acyl CoA:acetate/3-ketoacid CoA transferase beta subunit
MAVFSFDKYGSGQMILEEIASNTTLDEVKQATGAKYIVSPNLKSF